MNYELAEQFLIFKCISGSRAYNMEISGVSDLDVRGIFIAPPEYSIGCFKRVEQVEQKAKDEVLYELTKFIKLAVQCNPNIIELLFTPDENILTITPWFQQLRDNAHLFLSTKAKFTFSGYACAQLKRIKGHQKWLVNPQAENPPRLSQFCTIIWATGVAEKPPALVFEALDKSCFLVKTKGEYCHRVFSAGDGFEPGIFSDDGTQLKCVDVDTSKKPLHNRMFKGVLLTATEEFRLARRQWKDYWNWKRNRNKARAKMEEEYGFDGKHATHLVRLMKMAREILTTGQVIVKRPDAQELLDIRAGKWDYDRLIKWAEEQDRELDDLYEKSSLPKYPDLEKINELVMDIKKRFWREKGFKL